MLKVKNLVKEYNTENGKIYAIDDVSFEVEKGEVFGIIGLSGAGKSTLVRCINRLEEPTSGEVIIDGVNINELSKGALLEERKDIAMIFQHFNLFNQQTVFENVAFPLEIQGMNKNDIEKRVEEMLEFVSLEDKRNAYPSEISGGQKQRVAIARALASNPKVLLSDESTSALDPENTDHILKLLKESVKKFNMTIIMITHEMEVVKKICDKVAVMEDGKIIESGKVSEIFANPKSIRTWSFINSLPDVVEEDFSLENFSGNLFRLHFDKENSKEPVINNLMKNSNATINILSGNLNTLVSGESIGYLTVEISGNEKDVSSAVDALKRNKVNVEVING